MIKIVDIDGLFEDYVSSFVKENIGKIKPEEIENEIPVLYDKFGKEKLKELDGETPKDYYKKFSAEELVFALKEHLKSGVSVNDYLCVALTEGQTEELLLNELENDFTEDFAVYAMNVLNDKKSTAVLDKYLDFIVWDYPETVKELAAEFLTENGEAVKERIVEGWSDFSVRAKSYLTEVLANTSSDDERVLSILLEQFALNTDNIPLYANYLAKFGNDKAIPVLTTAIESEGIKYHEFEELRFAIEALGGFYAKERDFSKDSVYKKIKGIK